MTTHRIGVLTVEGYRDQKVYMYRATFSPRLAAANPAYMQYIELSARKAFEREHPGVEIAYVYLTEETFEFDVYAPGEWEDQ